MTPEDVTLYGSEWTLTATLVPKKKNKNKQNEEGKGQEDEGKGAAAGAAGAAGGGGAQKVFVGSEPIVVGVMFYEDTYAGLGRLSAFHEHIGCTDCNAFFESEKRSGPWIHDTHTPPG